MALDKDDIKQLIAILSKGLEDDPVEEVVVKQKPQPKSKPKRKFSQETTNLFEDMPEYNMHKADIAIDKKLSVYPPTARSRKYNNIDVVCRVCGKTDSVNPSLVETTDRYKCNSCSRSPG